MDQEVAKTLGELELKLQQLEYELTAIGHHDTPAAQSRSQAPGRLVDEAVEATLSEQALADGDGFGGPPVFGGEEVPSQAGATVERDWTVEAKETAYGEIPTPPAPPTPGPPIPPPAPAPPPPPQTPPTPTPQPEPTPRPIDRAELVRFKLKLERTMGDLLDEYNKLLSPKPPA